MKARQEITGAVTLAARHRVATAAAAVLAPTGGLSPTVAADSASAAPSSPTSAVSLAGWKLRLTVTALPAS
ncbi:MAG TPA: hypothetical protein VGZ32_25880 [Actinocrinis sp.]|jgi:hypothetical protein|uniref:hypothetical protein n=1 Tax=Actinocrinis sp. TaxID=1920516 RepID=UPI002DDD34E9|nr:hypothetical protein [Actinocrinis sp.]HEV3173807.1 hypothetical protein [Actinocrinis sp.]